MLRNVKWAFWLAVGFQFVILSGLVAAKQYTSLTGQRVLLRTRPVDPRSLFRGDYVILDYEISALDPGELTVDIEASGFGALLSSPRLERGDAVYVVLQPRGDAWVARSIHKERPDLDRGRVALRGEVSQDFWWSGSKDPIRVKYGIESYFVPEGTGGLIERAGSEEITVEVAVDHWGNGVVRRVFVGGVAFDELHR